MNMENRQTEKKKEKNGETIREITGERNRERMEKQTEKGQWAALRMSGPLVFFCLSFYAISLTITAFYCIFLNAVESISLIRFSWFTSLAPGS